MLAAEETSYPLKHDFDVSKTKEELEESTESFNKRYMFSDTRVVKFALSLLFHKVGSHSKQEFYAMKNGREINEVSQNMPGLLFWL